MARVYVSSTFTDLERHRAAVIAALRRAGHELAVMEDYPAFDERPAEKCVHDVASCDVYVGIVAFRYGFIPPQNNPESASITEMEYIAARDKKRLIFQLHPDAPWPRRFSDEVSGEAERGRLIERFRSRLSSEHGNRYFDSPEDLATQVLAAVSSLGHPSSARIPSDVSQLIVTLLTRH